MKLTVLAMLVASLAVSFAAENSLASVPTNRITNGGFELPTVVGGNQEFGAPSTAITGWQVSAGSIDLITSGSILGSAHSDLQMIDINGSSAGAVEQTFATVPGYNYRLELYYSNNPNPASALPSYSASIRVLGATQLLHALVFHAGATELNMNWSRFAQSFTADSATTTLKLSSNQGGFNGIYFDSVSVIPEPSSIALITPIGMLVTFLSSRPLRQFHPRKL